MGLTVKRRFWGRSGYSKAKLELGNKNEPAHCDFGNMALFVILNAAKDLDSSDALLPQNDDFANFSELFIYYPRVPLRNL
jgi:hypothetical protein